MGNSRRLVGSRVGSELTRGETVGEVGLPADVTSPFLDELAEGSFRGLATLDGRCGGILALALDCTSKTKVGLPVAIACCNGSNAGARWFNLRLPFKPDEKGGSLVVDIDGRAAVALRFDDGSIDSTFVLSVSLEARGEFGV